MLIISFHIIVSHYFHILAKANLEILMQKKTRFNLFEMLCLVEFFFATLIASLDISIPTPLELQ